MTPNEFKKETMKHQHEVVKLISKFCDMLMLVAVVHDDSKLYDPELSEFTKATSKLAGLTYGSPEYKESLRLLGPALDHHYKNNRHHPEHFNTFYCPICCEYFEDVFVPKEGKCKGLNLCPKCSNGKADDHFVISKKPNIEKMNLIDLVEMLCDWKAASLRHNDGDIIKSIDINGPRFGINYQLLQIFKNTIDLLS